MNIIANILITAATVLASVFGIYNYVPLRWFEIGEPPKKLGTTVTTIAATDTIKNSRTTINDNFSNLNNGKIENATTSLPAVTTMAGLTSATSLATIGTITSGTWNGSTLAVSYGGTGSTTLSANHILVGNGTGALGVINGFGTSGQSLVSNGEATLPTWQTTSFDKTQNQNPLTGDWNFTGTARIKNLNASSTSANPITLNGVNYNTPSTQGASSTALTNDGSGNLKWIGVPYLLGASSSPNTSTTIGVAYYLPVATTTVNMPTAGNVFVSANLLGSNDVAGHSCVTTIFQDNKDDALSSTYGFGYTSAQNTSEKYNLNFTYSTTTTSGQHFFTLYGKQTNSAGSNCTILFGQLSVIYLGQ